MKTEAKKQTKLERLQAALAVARERLEATQAELAPALAAERVRVEGLQEVYEQADKRSGKAWETFQLVRRELKARMFPTETQNALESAIAAFTKSKGLPDADVRKLADTYISERIHATPEYVEAETNWRTLNKKEESARRALWAAKAPGSKLSRLEYRISECESAVENLEKQIERLPVYRANARERRAEEKADALRAEQTRLARELMTDFTWMAR